MCGPGMLASIACRGRPWYPRLLQARAACARSHSSLRLPRSRKPATSHPQTSCCDFDCLAKQWLFRASALPSCSASDVLVATIEGLFVRLEPSNEPAPTRFLLIEEETQTTSTHTHTYKHTHTAPKRMAAQTLLRLPCKHTHKHTQTHTHTHQLMCKSIACVADSWHAFYCCKHARRGGNTIT